MKRITNIEPYRDRVLNLCDSHNLMTTEEEYVIQEALRGRQIDVDIVATDYDTLSYRSYLRFPSEADRIQFLLMVGDFQKFKLAAKMYVERNRNRPFDPSGDWWDW